MRKLYISFWIASVFCLTGCPSSKVVKKDMDSTKKALKTKASEKKMEGSKKVAEAKKNTEKTADDTKKMKVEKPKENPGTVVASSKKMTDEKTTALSDMKKAKEKETKKVADAGKAAEKKAKSASETAKKKAKSAADAKKKEAAAKAKAKAKKAAKKAKKKIQRTKEGYLKYWNKRYFSHKIFHKILRKHVRGGRVNYVAIRKKSMKQLSEYLYRIARTNPYRLRTRSQRYAFWINAYNALTIKGVLNHYPKSRGGQSKFSVLRSVKGFWKKYKYKVGGKMLTLNDIEHKIMRPTFKDPRLHFVLVCAAKGCPKLVNYAYSGYKRGLNRQLDRATRGFLRTKRGFRLDRGSKTVHASQLFNWYKGDFKIPPYGHELVFIAKYIKNQDDAKFLTENKGSLKIKYTYYDWSLNQRW